MYGRHVPSLSLGQVQNSKRRIRTSRLRLKNLERLRRILQNDKTKVKNKISKLKNQNNISTKWIYFTLTNKKLDVNIKKKLVSGRRGVGKCRRPGELIILNQKR